MEKDNKLLNFFWNTREKFKSGEINESEYEKLICNALVTHPKLDILTVESIVSVVLGEF